MCSVELGDLRGSEGEAGLAVLLGKILVLPVALKMAFAGVVGAAGVAGVVGAAGVAGVAREAGLAAVVAVFVVGFGHFQPALPENLKDIP